MKQNKVTYQPRSKAAPPPAAPAQGQQEGTGRKLHCDNAHIAPGVSPQAPAGRPAAKPPARRSQAKPARRPAGQRTVYSGAGYTRGGAHAARRRKKRGNPSQTLLMVSIVLLLLGIFALARFWQYNQSYQKSNQYYSSLRTEALAVVEDAGQEQATVERVDFDLLRQQNESAAAWLEVPCLNISLPVVQPDDNSYYLHHGFDGQSNANGCLFFAAGSSASDLYRVIYGHNIHTGAMFGGLSQYASAEFCRQNPTFTLFTPDETLLCTVFSCHTVKDADPLYNTNWVAGAEYDAFLQELAADSDYDTGVQVPSGSRVLTLSTCSSSYGSGLDRFVVHALVQPQ